MLTKLFMLLITRGEIIYSKLVDEVNKKDLMLKATLDSSELLIFSSLLLPENYWSEFCILFFSFLLISSLP